MSTLYKRKKRRIMRRPFVQKDIKSKSVLTKQQTFYTGLKERCYLLYLIHIKSEISTVFVISFPFRS
jgi:hypothetical protein